MSLLQCLSSAVYHQNLNREPTAKEKYLMQLLIFTEQTRKVDVEVKSYKLIVCQFPRIFITRDHNLGARNTRIILLSFWGLKSEISVLVGLFSLWNREKRIVPCLFQLLVAVAPCDCITAVSASVFSSLHLLPALMWTRLGITSAVQDGFISKYLTYLHLKRSLYKYSHVSLQVPGVRTYLRVSHQLAFCWGL